MAGNYYEKLQTKKSRVREEHSLKEAHPDNFALGAVGIAKLYDRIFSVETIASDPRMIVDMYADQAEDLMMSISLSPQLFKIYVANGISLIAQEALKRGVPSEHVEDTRREMFLQLAEAESYDEISEIALLAAGEFNRRYRLYALENYSYQVILAINYMQRNRYKNISISEVAEAVSSDRTYLAKIFKKETGLTLSEYKTRIKMETASDLIYSHTYTLAEIAELLGYTSYAVFNRNFTAYFGVNPKKYESSRNVHNGEKVL